MVSSSTNRCIKLYFKVFTWSFVLTIAIWAIVLFGIRSSIDWKSRSISATCFDLNSTEWGSLDYYGEWMECDVESNGYGATCTPWGYSCRIDDSYADRCPLDMGGEGDGCKEPSSIYGILFDMMILHLGSTPTNPMVNEQSIYSIYFVISILLILPLSLVITYCKWESNQARKYTVPTELLPGVVTAIEIDSDDDDESYNNGDNNIDVEQKTIYRSMV